MKVVCGELNAKNGYGGYTGYGYFYYGFYLKDTKLRVPEDEFEIMCKK
jgi:hypothetical protein